MNQNILSQIDTIRYLDSGNFFLIAGPCVIESEKIAFDTAEKIIEITDKLKIPFIYKSSYRKANRQRIDSFTGIGDEKALRILRTVGEMYDIPVLTDIHNEEEATMTSQYVDVIQIPAFLCRQTDLLIAAARTGRVVNIKKANFLHPAQCNLPLKKLLIPAIRMLFLPSVALCLDIRIWL
jgi:2-dehydro-3-deoxyphosphooctonate aldolase (KDO 8-P synthase)